jgi:predicted Zn-dependent protease with MMP-like domain
MSLRPRTSSLELIAQRVVAQVLRRLPSDLAEAAQACVIELSRERLDDEDLLGLFEGNARNDPDPQSVHELPRITLFLDALWDYTDRDVPSFREEVKTTLLHELGHYLGLDEAQVEALGLG